MGLNGYAQTFTYDPAGNRIKLEKDGTLTRSEYDAANQLRYTNAAAGRTTYTFDADGNQQTVLEPSGDRTTTTWDYENQPTVYNNPDDSRVTMTYSADNRRVAKEILTAETKFVWDEESDNVLLETDDFDATQVVYTNEPGQFGSLISGRRSMTTHWYHFDALGSTSQLTDSSATITDTYLYDAWGNVISSTGSTINPFQWVGALGYYTDPETGQFSVRARVYQPKRGRWQAKDPMQFVDSHNRYLYAHNSPLLFVDPSGLTVQIWGWEGFGAAVKLSYTPIKDVYKKIAEAELGKEVSFKVRFQKVTLGTFAQFNVATSILARAKKVEREKGCIKCFPRIVLIGYSLGAVTATNVAAMMQLIDTKSPKVVIDAVYTIDPVFLFGKGGGIGTHETVKAISIPFPILKPTKVIPSGFCVWNNYYQTVATRPKFIGDKLAWANNILITKKKLQTGPYANAPKGVGAGPSAHLYGHVNIPYLKRIQDDWRKLMKSFKGNSMRTDPGKCKAKCPFK